MSLSIATIFQNPRYRGNGGELSIPVLASIRPLALWAILRNSIQLHLKASFNCTMTDNYPMFLYLRLARKQEP